MENLITTEQLSVMTGIPLNQLRLMTGRREIPFIKRDGKVLFEVSVAEKLNEKHS